MRDEVATVRIGKMGISQNSLEEILKVLKARKEIKVKFLRNFLDSNDKKDSANKILLFLSEKNNSTPESKLTGNILLIRIK